MMWPWEWIHKNKITDLEEKAADTEAANRRLDKKLLEKKAIEHSIEQQLQANHFIARINSLFRD